MLRKGIRAIMWLILAAALVYAALFAYVCIREKTIPAPGDTDLMIVLGAQVKPDGTPSVQLEFRLEAALDAYRRCQQPIVCCGGRAGQEPQAEGTVMCRWLEEHGVPADSLFAETASETTRENIKNAAALLDHTPDRVLIVTSDYHLPRALAIAGDAGFKAEGAAGRTLPEYWLKNHAREALAWGKYLLQKVTGTGV